MKMFRIAAIILFLLVLMIQASNLCCAGTVEKVVAEGSCAIVGMSAEQCQLIALQRARASAIEQVVGTVVASGSLVTNMVLTAEFIKTYSRGFIVHEKVEWLPLGQYQKDLSEPPIPEYRVRIIADVRVSEPSIRPLGLRAKTNSVLYKNGDKAVVEIDSGGSAKIGIFNMTADDKVVMVFPNGYDKENSISRERRLVFPDRDTKTELIMHTLDGHRRDDEAFFIAALDESCPKDFIDIFSPYEIMSVTEFFRKYSDIADCAENVILTYEVVNVK